MSGRKFLPWVDPVAKQLREGRIEVVRTAQQLLPEHWSQPSPLQGWTYRDLLAHLASGDWVFQMMLRDVLGIEKKLPEQATMDYVNEGNTQRVAERKDISVEELIAEIAATGETTQDLLSRLTDEIEPSLVAWRRPNGDPVTLEQWVRGFSAHDTGHGDQLKTALAQVMMNRRVKCENE